MSCIKRCTLLAFLLAALALQATAQPSPAETKAEDPEYMPFDFEEADLPKYDEAELVRAIVYPAEARAARLEGTVVLEFVVNMEGRAKKINVISSTNPIFNAPSITAVEGLEFIPARMNGKPVNVRLVLPIRYNLFED